MQTTRGSKVRSGRLALLAGVLVLASACGPAPYLYEVDEPAASTPAVELGGGEVHVLLDRRLGRPAEVVAILDVHAPHGDTEGALDELRHAAGAVGADAVVGVELHHGRDGRYHLSGLAVRVLR